ncbi:MAG: hypothetical protein ACRD0G_01205 [Acidimicrobiales bacterium]
MAEDNAPQLATDLPRPAVHWAALAGLAGGGLALGVAELLAGPLDRVPSLVLAVGEVVIDNAPRWLVEFGIDTFGTADKQAVIVGVVVASMAMAALLGVGAARRPVLGRTGFVGFAVLGVLVAAQSPDTNSALTVFAALAAAAAGSFATELLLSRAPSTHRSARSDVAVGVSLRSGGSRRAFLGLAGSFAAVAIASAAVGRSVWGMSRAAAARAHLVLPRPARPLPAPAPGSEPDVAGLSPFFTPNSRFYRIDEPSSCRTSSQTIGGCKWPGSSTTRSS